MSAYDSIVSEHWASSLTNLPDAARGYFACYALIRNAWDSCINGAWLLRLAIELAADDQGRDDVRRVGAEVLREMASQLDRHFVERKIKDDPIRAAYDDAKREIEAAFAAIDKPFVPTAVAETEQAAYDRSIRVLRRFSSDLVRARLAHPIGLRPDPAFEDTKAIPKNVLPELARMKAEVEAAAAAVAAATAAAAGPTAPGVPSTSQVSPSTVPSTQPGSQAAPGAPPRPGPPRPTSPGAGTGGARLK